jgi:hypothetical protein
MLNVAQGGSSGLASRRIRVRVRTPGRNRWNHHVVINVEEAASTWLQQLINAGYEFAKNGDDTLQVLAEMKEEM